ncbi:vWA domain-containing protein, partial [Aliarcobacter cryaerophilus]|uniref:vWA domain-containing protein n=1 Tax=Aliarcobacter cryaerophilus TaxID=28198 RepID=UPI0021B5067D
DVFVDPTTISAPTDLATTNNSNYEDLKAVNSATKYDVADSIDITKINVTAENSIDGKNITLNVSLTNKDGLDTKVTNTPLEVVLNDGTKITIPVGETEGSITVPNPAPSGENITYSVNLNKTIGGNFEKLEGSSINIDTEDITPIIIIDPNTPNDNINGGSGDDILIGDTGGASKNIVPGKNYNIALVIDTSGSMKEDSGSYKTVIEQKNIGTNWWNPNWVDVEVQKPISRMELTIDALKNLANSLKDHDGEINVAIIDFSSTSKAPVSFNLSDTNALNNLINALNNLNADGGTNYEDAFNKTLNWFNSSSIKNSGYENVTYFLTDGDPTLYGSKNQNGYDYPQGGGNATDYQSLNKGIAAYKKVAALSEVNAIGIGKDINENYLKFFDNTGELSNGSVTIGTVKNFNNNNTITGGTVSGKYGEVDIVNTKEDLTAALIGGSSQDVVEKLNGDTITGGAGDDIIFGDAINTDHLTWIGRDTEGHKDYMIKGQGINALDKFLSLTKDGYSSMSEADKNMAKYDYIKEHHKELNVDGDTRGGDDTLSGGAGRDIIYGQGGNDTIITDINTNNGEADGDILIDGGTGFDTIKLEENNNIDFSKLGDRIKNIEAIDLTEGNHELTNISLNDVLNMTKDKKLIIFGDKDDTVKFKDGDGWIIKSNIINDVESGKKFVEWTNTNDATVSVKVEQPISDGVTN